MDGGDLKETLTKKYGPLPGYAWVGIGAIGLAVVVKLHKGTGAVPTTGSAVPATDGSLGDAGGGGGGFALPGSNDLTPDIPVDPGTITPDTPDPVTPDYTTQAQPTFAAAFQQANPNVDQNVLAALAATAGETYDPAAPTTDTTDRSIARAIYTNNPGTVDTAPITTYVSPTPVIHATPTKAGVNPSSKPKAPVSGYAASSKANLH